jgi:lipoprotein-anchoring transpeptidase ErfK/SrfK
MVGFTYATQSPVRTPIMPSMAGWRLVVVLGGVVMLAACTRAAEETAPSSPTPTASASIGVPSPKPDEGRLLPRGETVAAHPRKRYVEMRKRLDDPASVFVLDTRNPFMHRVPMLVTDARRDAGGEPWYRVLLPVKPNGSAAWVRGTEVRLVPRDQKIVVDLSERTLDHYVDGDLADHLSVGVGTPSAPTATGTFYVWIRVRYSSPTGPYGPFALGLSGFSEVLSEWPGGGRMAIHGTSDPSDRGHAVSHGCVRVYNPELKVLRHVPLGTPVIIKR